MATAPIDYARALTAENELLATSLTSAELSTSVPTCPGWTLLQLMRHVGRGDRWAAQMIHDNNPAVDPRQVPDGRPPDDASQALDWLRASAGVVIEEVSAVGADSPVATFLGPRPGSWWLRRRLHEATVHRADVLIALSAPYQLDPVLAADGIDEWVERIVQFQALGSMAPSLKPGQRLTLRTTDPVLDDVSWTVEGHADGVQVHNDSSVPADTILSGTAEDLFLAMVRRRTVAGSGIVLDGDPALWEDWLAGTPL